MNKFMSFIEEKFLPLANAVGQNNYLKSIANGSMSLLGVIMLGSIFTVIGSIPIDGYQSFLESTHLLTLINAVPAITTDLLAVYMAFSVAYSGAQTFGIDTYKFNAGVLSLMAFILLTPINTTALEGSSFLDISYLGSKGVFVALITGLVVVKIMEFFIKRDIRIKLPDSIPSGVTNSFTSLIPAAVIAVVFGLVKLLFSFTAYQDATTFIYTMLQTPLQNLVGSLPAFLVLILVAQLLWFFGIHGSMTVLPILFPIFLGYLAENSAAYAAGEAIPNIINFGLYDLACLGGCGCTIGLVILMTFFAKSERYKSFGKVVLPCGIFGVNEPVVFGLPLMLNVMMLIPFMLTPIVVVTIGYFLMKAGIISPVIGALGLGNLPPFFHGLVGGSVSFGIYELAAVLISMAIYYPFFKVLDKQALQEEMTEEQTEAEELQTEESPILAANSASKI